MIKKLALATAAVAALVSLPSGASATTLVGDSITCQTNTGPANSSCDTDFVGPFVASSATVVADGAPEFFFRASNAPNPLAEINFEDDILTITSFGLRGISQTILTFTNTSRPFFSVTTGSGLLAGRAQVTNGLLVVDLRGITFPAGESVSSFGVAAVPEPGTWLLMILGLGAVGFSMRRRQSAGTRLQFA